MPRMRPLLSDQDAGSRAKRRSERRLLQSLSTFGTRKSGEPYDTLRRATYGTEFLSTRARASSCGRLPPKRPCLLYPEKVDIFECPSDARTGAGEFPL